MFSKSPSKPELCIPIQRAHLVARNFAPKICCSQAANSSPISRRKSGEVEDDIQETAQILFNSSRLAAVDCRKRSVSRGATSILTNPRSPFAETRLQEQRTVKRVALRCFPSYGRCCS